MSALFHPYLCRPLAVGMVIMMNHIDVVLSGADKLSQQLDEVETLVHKLRRALAELEDRRSHLEMRLNPGESQEKA